MKTKEFCSKNITELIIDDLVIEIVHILNNEEE